jgi:2-C-methyl-D-erythritol 2,4-cyclodiphosphate synthase
MRIGFGYDIHPLVMDRPLILGGIPIPFEKGLDGHSDADVLCHAIADALLGAAALGDIGDHFPDTDPAFKDASSLDLLANIGELLKSKSVRICNVDATILAEKPKFGTLKTDMALSIAKALKIPVDRISVKATTNEGFDAVGRSEAVSVYSVALIEAD